MYQPTATPQPGYQPDSLSLWARTLELTEMVWLLAPVQHEPPLERETFGSVSVPWISWVLCKIILKTRVVGPGRLSIPHSVLLQRCMQDLLMMGWRGETISNVKPVIPQNFPYCIWVTWVLSIVCIHKLSKHLLQPSLSAYSLISYSHLEIPHPCWACVVLHSIHASGNGS